MKQVAKKKFLYGVLITLAGTLFVYSYPLVFVAIYRYFVPVTVTIIVPDGYRGPIAIIQASEEKDTEGARNPYKIVVPPNGIAKSWIPGIVPRLPLEYYSLAKYKNGDKIPEESELEYYDPSRVVFNFGGMVRYSSKSDSRGRLIFEHTIVTGFVGTEPERTEFQYDEWFLKTIKETPESK